jgi:hypothetical protein
MNSQDQENLKALFEGFMSPRQADQASEEIRRGEQILRECPAPQPNPELIAEIKAQVGDALAAKKGAAVVRIAYKVAAVAAVIIAISAISVWLVGGKGETVETPDIPWDIVNLVADDADLAALSAEIEQIEGDFVALQLGENGTNGHIDLAELEMELMDISGDFWKG